MSNGSPTAYLLWAILSTIFFIFLLVHLWLYDRFSCIKWDSGRQPGAFRRVMTYSYLATVPLLVVFSIAMAKIKFEEGYFVASTLSITPRPFKLWSHKHRCWLFPLNLILSLAWAFEMVTHLEELAFWLFLLHQGPERRMWFKSWEFKTWGLGSILAVMGLPLTAVIARNNIERTQAWIFLVGSIASSATTISFLYILFRFPGFIQQVKQGGAAPDVVVRLATFYNLNRIRVVFRFLFTTPLLTIGLDAFVPPYRVIRNTFAIDFLLMISGIGCFVSSAITLFVFFPRSVTHEAGYTTRMPTPRQSANAPTSLPEYHHEHDLQHQAYPQEHDLTYEYTLSRSKQFFHPSRPTYHPGSDHPTADGRPEAFVRSSQEIYHDEWIPRGSADVSTEAEEMESSPEYEFDGDELSSQGMPSPRSRSHPIHTERQKSQPQAQDDCFWSPERQDTVNTAVSQPNSGDTVVETQAPSHQSTAMGRPASLEGAVGTQGSRPGSRMDSNTILRSPSPVRLRRHSDAPFDSKNAGVLFPSQTVRTSEDGHQGSHERRPSRGETEKRTHRIRENSAPVIHPYLMNFTSPIDLLDSFSSDTHPSRMV